MKEPPDEQLHTRIRLRRTALKITQEEMAQALGVNRMAVVFMESGERKISAKELSGLCRLFQCSADELLFGKGKDDEPPFLRAYKRLSAEDQREVLELMEFKRQRGRKRRGA